MKTIKKDKSYLKAVKYYEEGRIDDALKMCEESISFDLKNSAAINLKGLLLYIKGDLAGAVNTWKINADYNDDAIAKNYIFDSKTDKEKINMFKRGEALLRSLAIEEALIVFNKCKESDFNAIRVNLALAKCYEKKGDYNKSSLYVTKVLELDKCNKEARALAKDIENIQGVKLEITRNRRKKVIAALFITVLLIGGTFGVYKFIASKPSQEESVQASNKEDEAVEEADYNEETKESADGKAVNEETQKGDNKKEALVNYDELNTLIESKSYDKIYEILKDINGDNLGSKEKTIYYNAKNLMENDGVVYYYKKGSELYNNGDIGEAKEYFQKGYEYGKKNYLYQHILFFNAACDEKMGNNDAAIKGYEEYYNNYKNETYSPEAAYKLALLYKKIDIDKSVNYARIVKEKYSDSIYNNDLISDLLKNN